MNNCLCKMEQYNITVLTKLEDGDVIVNITEPNNHDEAIILTGEDANKFINLIDNFFDIKSK